MNKLSKYIIYNKDIANVECNRHEHERLVQSSQERSRSSWSSFVVSVRELYLVSFIISIKVCKLI